MQENLYLIFGLILLLLVFTDFFYTTLSASGAAFLTKAATTVFHKFLLFFGKIFGRKVFNLSGLFINLPMLIIWLLLFWVGLFLVFSSKPEAIINSSGRIASSVERFYYTGYVISTLGLGNFKPTIPFFEIITSAFSLFGFVFITTSMTYLISVSSAVINKRIISLFVRNIGETPQELVQNLKNMKESLRQMQFNSLQELIDKHSNNHQTYPVIHFYHSQKKETSFGVNLTIMDEAISIILSTEKLKEMHSEVQPLRNSITNFLNYIDEKYGLGKSSVPDIDWGKLQLKEELLEDLSPYNLGLNSRRKVLGGLLKSEEWTWKEVYSEAVIIK